MALRLGLLSTANINGAILNGAAATDAVEVVAVGSRDAGRARAYADQHGIVHAHGSYEELLADEDVDAVYVSTPNALHVDNAIQALEAGKHVLCEKPLSRRAADAERAFDAAERAGLVLAEGFMYRHHPQMRALAGLLRDGALGEVRLVRAAFSFPLDKPGDPRWSRELDGGALMDVGCYCVNAVRFAAGAEPERVHAEQVLGGEGVDARLAALLRFPGGALATIDCGFDVPAQAGLEVVGADATVTIVDPWHGHTPGIELRRGDDVQTLATEPADPYRHELEDFAAAAAGERDPLLGRRDSVGQARAIELLYSAAATA